MTAEMARRAGVPVPMIVAFLVTLNAVAMFGQASWFHERITNHNGSEDWLVPIGVAIVVESIGVYLSSMAHAALMADQSAGLLRFGSYLVGDLVGTLNYWHYSPAWRPTPAAITFGALSAISPWLWAIYSRFRNRDRLAALGYVDVRGVKLSTSRKLWHPIRSIKVIRHAAWAGITNPLEAVASWEASKQSGRLVAPDEDLVAPDEDQVAPDDDQVVIPADPWEQFSEWVGRADRPDDDELIEMYRDKLHALQAEEKLSRYAIERMAEPSVKINRRQAERIRDKFMRQAEINSGVTS